MRTPATLDWGLDGRLSMHLSAYPGCTLSGQASAITGGPVRWRSVDMVFGAACPTVWGGMALEGRHVTGGIDAKSGDEFVLFGVDSSQNFSLVLPAKRRP